MICGTVMLTTSLAVGLLDFYQSGLRWLNIALLGGVIVGAIAISLIGTAAHGKADDKAGVARMHIPSLFRKRSDRAPDATNAAAQPRLPGTFRLCSLSCPVRAQSFLRLGGGHRHSAGHPRI